jgi:hypothetical protein
VDALATVWAEILQPFLTVEVTSWLM